LTRRLRMVAGPICIVFPFTISSILFSAPQRKWVRQKKGPQKRPRCFPASLHRHYPDQVQRVWDIVPSQFLRTPPALEMFRLQLKENKSIGGVQQWKIAGGFLLIVYRITRMHAPESSGCMTSMQSTVWSR
jgi:hypothetical protein